MYVYNCIALHLNNYVIFWGFCFCFKVYKIYNNKYKKVPIRIQLIN